MRFCFINYWWNCCSWQKQGQATVEAAFMIPIFFIVLMLLIQPGILLYDKMIMNAAAQHSVRLVATLRTQSHEDALEVTKHYLEAIPHVEMFHASDWEISIEGDECSDCVTVDIAHSVALLPFFAQVGDALGVSGAGLYEMNSSASSCKQTWLSSSKAGLHPEVWISRWKEAV